MRRFLFVLVLGTLLALVYVQQRVWLVTTGYRVEEIRSAKDELLDQHRVLHYNVLALRSPVILDERLAQRRVQLSPPEVVEVLLPRLPLQPSSSPWGRRPAAWWQEVLRLGTRWFGVEGQAVAEPVRSDR